MIDLKFDLNDIQLVAATLTDVNSRSQINIKDSLGMYRLFTAPMLDVISNENCDDYVSKGVYAILPRKKEYSINDISSQPKVFQAYGIDDIEELYLNNDIEIKDKHYALIDVANGHMKKVFTLVENLKTKYKESLVLMAGNISNPATYRAYASIGLDYIRVSVGTGSACLTSQQTAIGYPLGSLLYEINKIKKDLGDNATKVIADGGFKDYSDIIKAYALGADYVMLGSVLNKTVESSGRSFIESSINGRVEVDSIFMRIKYNLDLTDKKEINSFLFKNKIPFYKEYRGMSTKDVQRELNRNLIKTSEGITKYNKVEYTLNGWLDNYKDYLRSSLSYCSYFEIDEFIGNTPLIRISENAFKRFNK